MVQLNGNIQRVFNLKKKRENSSLTLQKWIIRQLMTKLEEMTLKPLDLIRLFCILYHFRNVIYRLSLKFKNNMQNPDFFTEATHKLNSTDHQLRCLEHSNPIQRICLHAQCQNRVLCLLCQTHLHGRQFLSILDKPTESYKRFCETISDEIDFYILQLKSNEDEVFRMKQREMLEIYYKQLKNRLEIFLQQRQREIFGMLESSKYKTVQMLRNARISGDFVNIQPSLFTVCFRAYEGEKISQILQNNQLLKSEEVYSKVDSLHESLRKTMEDFGFNMKIRIPEIRNKDEILEKKTETHNAFSSEYEAMHFEEKKIEYKLLCETEPFDSIIASSLRIVRDEIITVSYDKKLRIHKKNNRTTPDFDLLMEKEYSNILTKIHKIGEDLYAIGQSKQLLIEKIDQQKKGSWQCKNIMKLLGHQQRIVDISSYNTRIIGSASHEGAKIWDLCKEKCQFTFKETYNPSALIFLPKINNLAIGYNNRITKLYSIERLKTIRKYELPGLPLVFSQEKLNQNTFYVGGFTSNLAVLDVRLNKLAFSFNFGEDAVSSLSEMLFQENKMLLGFRNGVVKVFDLQMRKVKGSFRAENTSSHLSKPNGIVGVYEEDEKEIVTVGCNERKLKLWEVQNTEFVE